MANSHAFRCTTSTLVTVAMCVSLLAVSSVKLQRYHARRFAAMPRRVTEEAHASEATVLRHERAFLEDDNERLRARITTLHATQAAASTASGGGGGGGENGGNDDAAPRWSTTRRRRLVHALRLLRVGTVERGEGMSAAAAAAAAA